MAIPVLTLLALLARAATSILTHPTSWLMLFAWCAISVLGIFIAAHQLQQSITDLWWLVVLILVTVICNTAIKAHFQARRRGDP